VFLGRQAASRAVTVMRRRPGASGAVCMPTLGRG
jgi:hypothetical protein